MWYRTLLIGCAALCVCLALYLAFTTELSSTQGDGQASTSIATSTTALKETGTPSEAIITPRHDVQHVAQKMYKRATTTVFWVGEGADASNGYIANDASAWDSEWQQHFGGYDDPLSRCGYAPCNFVPLENAFYVALPYNDLDVTGSVRADAARVVPWWSTQSPPKSQVKNRWIEVIYKGRTCYGQWQDVGPYIEDDAAYVFGTATPQNTFGLSAGLDVSPALNDCLHLGGAGVAEWRFVEFADVPPGPWRDTVTVRDVWWN